MSVEKDFCSEGCRSDVKIAAIIFAVGVLIATTIAISLLIPKDVYRVQEIWNLDRYQITAICGILAFVATYLFMVLFQCRRCW